MGLRSPQQLQRAKAKEVQPNQAKVAPFQDNTLTEAVSTGVNAYNTEYNRNLRVQRAKNRSDAIAKVSIKNRINETAKLYQAQLAELRGSQVVTDSQPLLEKMSGDFEKERENIPEEYRYIFDQERNNATTDFKNKYAVKAYSEETLRLDSLAAGNIKTKMQEASNKISEIIPFRDEESGTDPDPFSIKIKELDEAVKDSFVAKGLENREVELRQAQVQARSKALLQGIETFAASKRTDLLDMAQKAFDAYGNSESYMTLEDREAAFKALAAGKASAKGEIAYQLASSAIQSSPDNASILDIKSKIFVGTKDADIAIKAGSLADGLYNARDREIRDNNISARSEVLQLLRQEKPKEALNRLQQITDGETFNKALEDYNQFYRGNIASDPDVVKSLEERLIANPESFDRINLDGVAGISARDRQMFETKRQIAAKKKSDSRYGLLTGEYETSAIERVGNTIEMLHLEKNGEVMHPTRMAENRLKLKSEYYKILNERPQEFNRAVIEKELLDRARKDLYLTVPKKFGPFEVPQTIGVGDFKVKVPTSISQETIPNPDFGEDITVTAEELQRAKRAQPNVDEKTLRNAIISIKRRQKQAK